MMLDITKAHIEKILRAFFGYLSSPLLWQPTARTPLRLCL